MEGKWKADKLKMELSSEGEGGDGDDDDDGDGADKETLVRFLNHPKQVGWGPRLGKVIIIMRNILWIICKSNFCSGGIKSTQKSNPLLSGVWHLSAHVANTMNCKVTKAS